MINHYSTQVSNILVIGSGGAGLRAAIQAKMSGLDVVIIGKRNKVDVHTCLAAGGINAAFGNIDCDDNWEHHFADTYNEGYGLGEPGQIELMAKESPILVKEIDEWGANFAKLENGKLDQRFFGAHTYRRTCYSGDYTGRSILLTLLNKTKELKIPIYDSQFVYELLVKDNVCFGAMSFNTKNGERTIHYSDAVIICTGGHTRLWKKSTSRKNENTGDGYYLALKAGCKLKDMEMVQFHPTGMLSPEEMSGTLVTEAVRGEGGQLFNNKGERFMKNYDSQRMELSTRDRVAMANYTEIVDGRGTINGGVLLDISHKQKSFILDKLPQIYMQFIENQMLDISQEPMEVAPTAHYSMGGICVESETHSTSVSGLFAAGESAGGLHGANRLGGNSLAEILIFGKRVGNAAVNYSRKINSQYRCLKTVNKSFDILERKLVSGKQIATKVIYELRSIMWEHCGVVRDEIKLKKGIKKIQDITNQSDDIHAKVNLYSQADVINKFELESSLITSLATAKSALERRESRGAHQRSDYKEISNSENCNIYVEYKNNEILITKKETQGLNSHLKDILEKSLKVEILEGRLLE